MGRNHKFSPNLQEGVAAKRKFSGDLGGKETRFCLGSTGTNPGLPDGLPAGEFVSGRPNRRDFVPAGGNKLPGKTWFRNLESKEYRILKFRKSLPRLRSNEMLVRNHANLVTR